MPSMIVTRGAALAAVVVTLASGASLHAGARGVSAAPAAVRAPGTYVSVPTPRRILDTRHGIGAPNVQPKAGSTTRLKVAGVGGVPGTGVSAVVLTVIAAEPVAAGYLTVYPDVVTRPGTSTINFDRSESAFSNTAMVALTAGGYVRIYNSASTQLAADITGYYVGGGPATAPGTFTPVTPARILDSRRGVGRPGAGSTTEVTVGGVGGVPSSGVSAVVLNVAVSKPSAEHGYATVYGGDPRPPHPSVLPIDLLATANLVVVPLSPPDVGSPGGSVNVFTSTAADLVVDVLGYYRSGTPTLPGAFKPLLSTRVLDFYRLEENQRQPIAVDGRPGFPAGVAAAVVLNLTLDGPEIFGYGTVFSDDLTTVPGTSNLNYPGRARSSAAVSAVSTAGRIAYYSSDHTYLTVDVAGYFLAG